MASLFRHSFRMTSIQQLAIPSVSFLIAFLAYGSQYLFYFIEPGHLKGAEFWWFNGLVLALWWCYYKACSVDPAPKGWVEKAVLKDSEEKAKQDEENEEQELAKGMRWCKKCKAVKPPRAHHCKQCGRCIPKMDHHCPWTMNCVSYTNFPHFIRFVLYAVISMSILSYHLFTRLQALWSDRNLPAYLGPSVAHLALLFVIVLSNSLVLFALVLLLTSAGRSLVTNTSQIESWEIERHEDLVSRARKMGGYVYANGGQKMRIERQEFPYDIGFWSNLCQAMGTSNVLMWFMPFGGAPGIEGAADWEVNGFEDESKTWPPADPDKMGRNNPPLDHNIELSEYGSVDEEMAAFRKRQQEDYARRVLKSGSNGNDYDEIDYESEYEEGVDGEEGWTNTDGERLQDYGVDDDDIPLGELLRRRKARTQD